MLPTAPGYTIKKDQALGQLPLVHTGFRLIFVLIQCILLVRPHREGTPMTSGWSCTGCNTVTMEWHSSITKIDKPLLRWNRPSLQFSCFHLSPMSRSFSWQVNTLYNNPSGAIKNTLLNQKLTSPLLFLFVCLQYKKSFFGQAVVIKLNILKWFSSSNSSKTKKYYFFKVENGWILRSCLLLLSSTCLPLYFRLRSCRISLETQIKTVFFIMN